MRASHFIASAHTVLTPLTDVLVATRVLPTLDPGSDRPDDLKSTLDPIQLTHLHLLLKFIYVLASTDFHLSPACQQFVQQFIAYCSHENRLCSSDLAYTLREDICETLLIVASECRRSLLDREKGADVTCLGNNEVPWTEEDICWMVVDNSQWTGTRVPCTFRFGGG
jgi:hypothetical protein